MAYDVIKKAASIHKGVSMDSFEDEVIVCECARVSLATIKNAIKINDLKTVEDITNYTKAGGYCKSCVKPGGHEEKEYYLVDILRDTRAEMEEQEKLQEREKKADEMNQNLSDKKFKDLTVVQKLKRLEEALDETVRPSLALDGGNLEVIDIKEVDGVNEIYIRYLGGCAGCPSGLTGTLYGIENALAAELEDEVRVIPV